MNKNGKLPPPEGRRKGEQRVDTRRRRLVAGMAAATGAFLAPESYGAPASIPGPEKVLPRSSFPLAPAISQMMQDQLSDRKCVIRKGSLETVRSLPVVQCVYPTVSSDCVCGTVPGGCS